MNSCQGHVRLSKSFSLTRVHQRTTKTLNRLREAFRSYYGISIIPCINRSNTLLFSNCRVCVPCCRIYINRTGRLSNYIMLCLHEGIQLNKHELNRYRNDNIFGHLEPEMRTKIDVIHRATGMTLRSYYNDDLNTVVKVATSEYMRNKVPVKVVSDCGYVECIGGHDEELNADFD